MNYLNKIWFPIQMRWNLCPQCCCRKSFPVWLFFQAYYLLAFWKQQVLNCLNKNPQIYYKRQPTGWDRKCSFSHLSFKLFSFWVELITKRRGRIWAPIWDVSVCNWKQQNPYCQSFSPHLWTRARSSLPDWLFLAESAEHKQKLSDRSKNRFSVAQLRPRGRE